MKASDSIGVKRVDIGTAEVANIGRHSGSSPMKTRVQEQPKAQLQRQLTPVSGWSCISARGQGRPTHRERDCSHCLNSAKSLTRAERLMHAEHRPRKV